YVMGGEYQIRGVELRSVGPLDEDQRVVGGDKFVLFNAEYYLDVFGPVRALLFHDAGQAFAETQPIDLRQLRTSTGVELRVIVPMLNVPFRLIYAWNIYRDAFQPARALKFAVGTTFSPRGGPHACRPAPEACALIVPCRLRGIVDDPSDCACACRR